MLKIGANCLLLNREVLTFQNQYRIYDWMNEWIKYETENWFIANNIFGKLCAFYYTIGVRWLFNFAWKKKFFSVVFARNLRIVIVLPSGSTISCNLTGTDCYYIYGKPDCRHVFDLYSARVFISYSSIIIRRGLPSCVLCVCM